MNHGVCFRCRAGVGDECHTPGCVYWMDDVPPPAIPSTHNIAPTSAQTANQASTLIRLVLWVVR